MPIEICQASRVLSAQSVPCDTCANRPKCLAFTAWRQLFETPDPLFFKKHVISECSGYVPYGGGTEPLGKSIRPSLSAARVSHLCNGCPDGEKSACRTEACLGEIRRTADAVGLKINFTVYACKTRRQLLQIGG